MSKATYQPLPQTDSLSEPENDGTSGDILLEVPDQTSRQKKKSLKSDEEKSAKRKKTQITLKDLQVIKTLLPYLWCDLGTKIRVVVALICLVLAKVFKVLVPIFYKYVVDPLNDTSGVITIPILWILIYGIASLLSTVFGNLRDAIFVNVQQNAMKEAAIDTFVHLHKLSLRFHLHRKTGGILRAIDRGKEAIETLMYAFLFSIGPTLLEICFTWFILFLQYKFWYFLVTFITVGLHRFYNRSD
jgi:ABC-type multidrug transport system fused ATPase/permease subunit